MLMLNANSISESQRNAFIEGWKAAGGFMGNHPSWPLLKTLLPSVHTPRTISAKEGGNGSIR